ncbi:MAG: TIR domain-containing protein [Chloroflexota bacterium]
MSETKRPLKVFLCHASADKPKVRELYRYLRKRGIKPWFDEVNLVGGQDWQSEIPKALVTSDAIIICLTKNSVDKEGYIQKEIKFALDKALEMPEGRIFLIPVRFEECEVPFSLSRYQWVDLFNEVGYARMMRALKFRALQLERTTIELPKKDFEEEKLGLEEAISEREEREVAERVTNKKAELEVDKMVAQEISGRESDKLKRSETGVSVQKEIQKKQNVGELGLKVTQEKVGNERREYDEEKASLSVQPTLRQETEPKKPKLTRKLNGVIVIALIGLAGTILAGLLASSLLGKWLTPPPIATFTSTPTLTTTVTLTPTATLAVNPNVTATFIPAGSIPTSYTLQQGEFLYCIARRFNVDPDEILALNGIADSQSIYSGFVLKIPQTGNSFPGNPMMRNHPTSYIVQSSDETVYSVACSFGDVYPEVIAQKNNIPVNATLTSGQFLSIP